MVIDLTEPRTTPPGEVVDEPSRNARWRTRDGRVIAIKDMSDNHLRNTTRMVFRLLIKLVDVAKAYPMFGGVTPRGEMAQLAVEQEEVEIMDELTRLESMFTKLHQECHRRGIDTSDVPPELIQLMIARKDKVICR